jgi:hypothetical protein
MTPRTNSAAERTPDWFHAVVPARDVLLAALMMRTTWLLVVVATRVAHGQPGPELSADDEALLSRGEITDGQRNTGVMPR